MKRYVLQFSDDSRRWSGKKNYKQGKYVDHKREQCKWCLRYSFLCAIRAPVAHRKCVPGWFLLVNDGYEVHKRKLIFVSHTMTLIMSKMNSIFDKYIIILNWVLMKKFSREYVEYEKLYKIQHRLVSLCDLVLQL